MAIIVYYLKRAKFILKVNRQRFRMYLHGADDVSNIDVDIEDEVILLDDEYNADDMWKTICVPYI